MHHVKGGAAASKGTTLLHKAVSTLKHFLSNAAQSESIIFKHAMEATISS